MLNTSPATRVFVAVAPVDMRQGYNGLSAMVQNQLQQDPLSGHLFVFSNQARNRLKILFWDGSGLWVCSKRLEKGTFTWPRSGEATAMLRQEELVALCSGLEVRAKTSWYRAGYDAAKKNVI